MFAVGKLKHLVAVGLDTFINPPLAIDNSVIAGNNLMLTVETNLSNEIKASIRSYNVTDEVGRIRGYGFDICVEDWTDSDYNDLYIAMVAWKTIGIKC